MTTFAMVLVGFLVGLIAGCLFTNMEKRKQLSRELLVDELMEEWEKVWDKDKCDLEKNGIITAENCDISYLDKHSKY